MPKMAKMIATPVLEINFKRENSNILSLKIFEFSRLFGGLVLCRQVLTFVQIDMEQIGRLSNTMLFSKIAVYISWHLGFTQLS